MGRIDAILKQKDLRIVDLFSASGFDTSGDGLLNAEEMQGALAKAGLKLNRIEARALIEYLDEDGSAHPVYEDAPIGILKCAKAMRATRASAA